jgi:hypothetical protein
MRQTIRAQLGTPTEQRIELHVRLVSQANQIFEVAPENRPAMIRLLLNSVRQREPDAEQAPLWSERIAAAERSLLPQFGRPTELEHQSGVRHAVWPVLAAVVS